MKRNRQKERGMLTVEAVLSLVPFILVIMGIISFINIFMVHNKVQYALYQAGNELSAYTYFYAALGLKDADGALGADIGAATEEINATTQEVTKFLEQVNSIESYEDVEGAVETGKNAIAAGKDLFSDPKVLLHNLVYKGIEKGEDALKSWVLGALASNLVADYLDASFSADNPMTADEYLSLAGVVGGMKSFDYGRSKLFSYGDYKMIDIVVEYDLEVWCFKLFIEEPKVHVVQRCSIPAWLDGDGKKPLFQ